MTDRWYDTREGIVACEQRGLAGLRDLSKARREAYNRSENLAWWCVWAHYVFDRCGNTLVTNENAPDYYTFGATPPAVFDREEHQAVDKGRPWSMSAGGIPPAEVCPHCFEGWTRSNHKDHFWDCNKGSFHQSCWDMKCVAGEIDFFTTVFEEAGLTYSELRLLPNGYSRRSPSPWFLLMTDHGPIKVGARKRVFEINWSHFEIAVDGTELFKDEEVTQAQSLVHAWGREKLIEYLRTLMARAGSAAVGE